MANLSFEKIAGALAVIGTTFVVAACGDVKPPEVPAVNATDAVPGAPAMADGGSCGAHKGGAASCGANKGGAASCSAKKDEVKAPETTAATTPTTTNNHKNFKKTKQQHTNTLEHNNKEKTQEHNKY